MFRSIADVMPAFRIKGSLCSTQMEDLSTEILAIYLFARTSLIAMTYGPLLFIATMMDCGIHRCQPCKMSCCLNLSRRPLMAKQHLSIYKDFLLKKRNNSIYKIQFSIVIIVTNISNCRTGKMFQTWVSGYT